MPTYKTPGVYVEEISTLPPSVAEVSTAVPAFIGCTANGPTPDNDKVEPQVARINTLLEYETLFGGAHPASFTVKTRKIDDKSDLREVETVNRNAPAFEYLLYYSLSLYFKNGGGSCYVVSIGNYKNVPQKKHFETGLARLEKEDEPTLILLPDAVNLADYYKLCQQALAQCNKLGDRFTVLDVVPVQDKVAVDFFRNGIGTKDLKYGAAYYPYLQTSLNFQFNENEVKLEGLNGTSDATWQKDFDKDSQGNGINISYTGNAGDTPEVKILAGVASNDVAFEITGRQLTIKNVTGEIGSAIVTAWGTFKGADDPQGFDILQSGDGSGEVDHTSTSFVELVEQTPAASSDTLADIKSTNTALYNQIKAAMNQQRVILPPSAAIAGVYASVDRERGVWKAPANVSLSAVIGPVIKINHEQQEGLNVDPTAGKSINAIRAFTGKGTLVWGARTLAGNDNEWRYVSVRWLFNMIEESTQKATAFAVFEPNDATTWLKVKAMIESYLYGLWEQGALAGPTSEAAYYVNVGLGKTMTTQDVLEGRMIVKMGIAAVRPAEFIILRFMHKLQEA